MFKIMYGSMQGNVFKEVGEVQKPTKEQADEVAAQLRREGWLVDILEGGSNRGVN